LFTTEYKRLKEDVRLFDVRFFEGEWIDWWAAFKNDAAGGMLSYARDYREQGTA
jgi:hypothetical protein